MTADFFEMVERETVAPPLRALSLRERAYLTEGVSAHLGASRARAQWWRQRYFGASASRFGRFIRTAGLRTRRDLYRVVELDGLCTASDRPGNQWVSWLSEVRMAMSRGEGAPTDILNEAGHVTSPFLTWCCRRFEIALEEDESLTQSERAIAAAAFRIWVHRRLFEAAVQSLAVALNIAAITGALVAKDLQARLAEFGRLAANTTTRDQLLAQTPLLDRCLAEIAGRTLEGAVEVTCL